MQGHLAEIGPHSKVLDDISATLSKHDGEILSCSNKLCSLSADHDLLKASLDTAFSRLSVVEKASSSTVRDWAPAGSAPGPAGMLDRLRRSHNVLLRGIPESDLGDDTALVSQIIDFVVPKSDAHRVSLERIGLVGRDRPRILRVTFNNPIVVTKLLRNKKVISSVPAWMKFSFSDDKTPLQIGELSQLREELKRRKNAGESNIDIKYVSGVPKIIKISALENPKN